MIELNIKTEEVSRVEHLRYNYPDPLIQRRFETIWLKYLGYPNNEIAKIANIHHDTVTDYIKIYNEGGCDQLQLTK